MKPVITRTLRVLSQVTFLVLLTAVVTGGLCALRAGSLAFSCPLGTLQMGLGARHVAAAVAAGALVLVVVALVVGRAFCGWMCPFGAVLDGIRALLERLPRWRSRPAGRAVPGPAEPARLLKYGVLAGALGGAAALRYPVFCPACPIGTLCRSVAPSGLGGGLEMAVVPVAGALELGWKRAWCRYACPLGALLGLVDRAGLSRTGRTRVHLPAADCLDCGRCANACPMNTAPLRDTGRALKADPEVIREAFAAGMPDVLYRNEQRDRLPGGVRAALRRRGPAFAVREGECIRCFECQSACPVAGRRAG